MLLKTKDKTKKTHSQTSHLKTIVLQNILVGSVVPVQEGDTLVHVCPDVALIGAYLVGLEY